MRLASHNTPNGIDPVSAPLTPARHRRPRKAGAQRGVTRQTMGDVGAFRGHDRIDHLPSVGSPRFTRIATR